MCHLIIQKRNNLKRESVRLKFAKLEVGSWKAEARSKKQATDSMEVEDTTL
jgi:hypothetical protein